MVVVWIEVHFCCAQLPSRLWCRCVAMGRQAKAVSPVAQAAPAPKAEPPVAKAAPQVAKAAPASVAKSKPSSPELPVPELAVEVAVPLSAVAVPAPSLEGGCAPTHVEAMADPEQSPAVAAGAGVPEPSVVAAGAGGGGRGRGCGTGAGAGAPAQPVPIKAERKAGSHPTTAKGVSVAEAPALAGSGAEKKDVTPPPPFLHKKVSETLIRQASALRVKYRCAGGQVRIPVEQVGFHPCNRDGQPPNGERCARLCEEIINMGYDADEANNSGVVVQQQPGTSTIGHFNARSCECDEYMAPVLAGCISYGSLSHSHLHQIFRNIRAGMKGGPSEICHPDGRYSIEKLRMVDPAFGAAIDAGLLWEILSWKIEVEEPEACSIIQAALNAKNGLFLMTHEMQAVAKLCTLAPVLAEHALAETTAVEQARVVLARTMPRYAEDENFIEMYRSVVDLGANQATFLKDLHDFHARFVDPQLRRLRLGVFGIMNIFLLAHAHVKIAGFKFVYSCDPKLVRNGFCEALTAKQVRDLLKDHTPVVDMAEKMLFCFHAVCTQACGVLFTSADQTKLFGNLDKDVFAALLGHKGEDRLGCVYTVGTKSWDRLLLILGAQKPKSLEYPFRRTVGKPAPLESTLQPRVIEFRNGVAITQQEEQTTTPPTETFNWAQFMITEDIQSSLTAESGRASIFLAISRLSDGCSTSL